MLYIECVECGKILSTKEIRSNPFNTRDLCSVCKDKEKNKNER